MSAEDEHRFGSGDPFTVGVEEELFLVDPVTGAQANTSTAVLERLEDLDGKVEREAACVSGRADHRRARARARRRGSWRRSDGR